MNSISHLSIKKLLKAAKLKQRIETLEKQLLKLLGSNGSTPKPAPKKRRRMSPKGRARIAAAQKARWAKTKGRKLAAKPVKNTRRKMSASAKAKISAAAKLRWKKAKAAGKKSL